MITTKTIHEIHNAKLDTLISEVEEELSLLVPTRTLYRDYFNTNKEKYKSRNNIKRFSDYFSRRNFDANNGRSSCCF